MTTPQPPERRAEVPFDLGTGWPLALPNTPVMASEAGIVLGIWLDDADWAWLSNTGVLTLRIDDHPATHGWTTTYPDGTETTAEFTIPTAPVAAPPSSLLHSRRFEEWVHETHGATGRLLVWDSSQSWWIVNDADLEVQLVCAAAGTFSTHRAYETPFEWLPVVSDSGRSQIAELVRRYSLR